VGTSKHQHRRKQEKAADLIGEKLIDGDCGNPRSLALSSVFGKPFVEWHLLARRHCRRPVAAVTGRTLSSLPSAVPVIGKMLIATNKNGISV
jgi:hypothetical protein